MPRKFEPDAFAVIHGLGVAILTGLLVWRSNPQPEELALLPLIRHPEAVTLTPLLALACDVVSRMGDVSVLGLRIVQGLGLLIAALCSFDMARLCRIPPALACLSGPLSIGAVFAVQPVFSHRGLFLPLATVAVWAIIRAVTQSGRSFALLAASSVASAVMLVPGDGLVLGLGLLAALFFGPHRAEGTQRFDSGMMTLMGGALVLGSAASVGWALTSLNLDAGLWRALNHVGEASVLEPGHFKAHLFNWISTSKDWVNLPIWYMKTGVGMGMLILVPLTAVLAWSWMLAIKKEPAIPPAPGPSERVALWFLSAWVFLSGVSFSLNPVDIVHTCGMAAGALLWCLVAAVRWMDDHQEPQLIFIRWLPVTLLGVLAASSWLVPIHAITRPAHPLASDGMQHLSEPIGQPLKSPGQTSDADGNRP